MANDKINIPGVGSINFMNQGVPPGCEPAGPGALSVWVAGKPAPQGSKRGYARRGQGGKLHVSIVEQVKAVAPWRADVRAALEDHGRDNPLGPLAGPVVVKLVFVMPRPASTPKKRTPAAVKRPDLDKLVRAVFDAIGSAGVWADDSQVVTVHAHKRLAELGETMGCMIHIEPAEHYAVTHDARPGGCCFSASLPSARSDDVR